MARLHSIQGNFAGFDRLGLGQGQLDDAVLVGRGHLVGLHRIGEGEGALKRNRLFPLLARGAQSQRVIQQLDVDVGAVNARQLGADLQVVLVFIYTDRNGTLGLGLPACEGGGEKGADFTIKAGPG